MGKLSTKARQEALFSAPLCKPDALVFSPATKHFSQKHNMSHDVFNQLKEELVANKIARFDEMQNKWDFLQSIYFCLIVITTIGYGHR